MAFFKVERAVAAWQLLLSGRFRLLDRWIMFVRNQAQLLTITEDTWRQVGSAAFFNPHGQSNRRSPGGCEEHHLPLPFMIPALSADANGFNSMQVLPCLLGFPSLL